MPKINIIPSGYRLTFTSWENDGDNYKTIIKEGVSEKETRLLVALAKIIGGRGCGLENNYEPKQSEKDKAYKILWPIFEQYQDVFDQTYITLFKSDIGVMTDYINDSMLGYASEGYWMRVLSDYKVEYIPTEIQIEDVTNKF